VSTILVADDEPAIREFFRVLLTNEGYGFIEAPDAATCIQLAMQKRPHLILLDWMMPGVDGMDTLRILKTCQDTREIPVVMVTALDGITEIRLATDAGADAYLTKPVEAADLLTLLRRYLQQPVTTF
jgi:CheY-like chemotaxis protein